LNEGSCEKSEKKFQRAQDLNLNCRFPTEPQKPTGKKSGP